MDICVGRRYFRFFKFLDCFSKASECLHAASGVVGLLEIGKWSFMGGYLFLESLTIVSMSRFFLLPVLIEEQLDTMGVWPSPWAELFTLEGNKLWFYSLVCSILLGWLQLYAGDVEVKGGTDKKAKGKKHSVQARKKGLGGVKRRMVVDGFDLFIPGFVTGWIVTTHAFVGFAGAISTVLSSKDIWDRLQQ